MPASWHALPTELHLAVVHLLPHNAAIALARTSSTAHALCLPAIFAAVSIHNAHALLAFARHVPAHYGPYIRSLTVCTTSGHDVPCTDALVTVLDSCSRLQSLSLSLATSLVPHRLIPAFARLMNVHSLEMASCGLCDESPLSERLVVALAASLPSLVHLSLSRITRSAMHVDPCDVPFDVPLVMDDFDVPPHPLLGTHLALPSLLRIPSLRSLQIRDTWLNCDTRLDLDPSIPRAHIQKLLLSGSMYADSLTEAQACTAWLRASAPFLCTLQLGTGLAVPRDDTDVHSPCREPLHLPRLSHVHINASRTTVDTLPSTLDVLSPSNVESISVTYNDSISHSGSDTCPVDEFARQCALDDLEDWRDAINTFLLGRSKEEWCALRRVDVSFGKGIRASWDL